MAGDGPQDADGTRLKKGGNSLNAPKQKAKPGSAPRAGVASSLGRMGRTVSSPLHRDIANASDTDAMTKLISLAKDRGQTSYDAVVAASALFQEVDTDHSGVITRDEWAAAFARIDRDKDGSVTRKEWLLRQESTIFFDLVDKRQSAAITLSEWSNAYEAFGLARQISIQDDLRDLHQCLRLVTTMQPVRLERRIREVCSISNAKLEKGAVVDVVVDFMGNSPSESKRLLRTGERGVVQEINARGAARINFDSGQQMVMATSFDKLNACSELSPTAKKELLEQTHNLLNALEGAADAARAAIERFDERRHPRFETESPVVAAYVSYPLGVSGCGSDAISNFTNRVMAEVEAAKQAETQAKEVLEDVVAAADIEAVAKMKEAVKAATQAKEKAHARTEVAEAMLKVVSMAPTSLDFDVDSVPVQQDRTLNWNTQDWLATTGCTATLASALHLLQKVPDVQCQLSLLQAMKRCGDRSLVLSLLHEGCVLDKLADNIWNGIEELSGEKSNGTDFHAKFSQDANSVRSALGDFSSSYPGLEALIGAPSPKTFKAMETEHSECTDSTVFWTTGNYGITTTPRIEWLFVVSPEGGPQQASCCFEQKAAKENDGDAKAEQGKWPTEHKLKAAGSTSFCRSPQGLATFKRLKKGFNAELAQLRQDKITDEEVIGVRLFTGPMFEKYNAAIRGIALHGEQSLWQSRKVAEEFRKLCQGNRYTTTIHVISSAMVKLSKLQVADTVYRGVNSHILPIEFWSPNEVGVCGGLEFGFLSTSLNRDVALSGLGNDEGSAAIVLEMKMGMFDRGADISMFSQYPHELEVCFSPATGVEVFGTRVDGPVLILEARLNTSHAPPTIDELICKRHKMVSQLCQGLMLETEQFLHTLPDHGEKAAHVMREQFLEDAPGLFGSSQIRQRMPGWLGTSQVRKHGCLLGQVTLREDIRRRMEAILQERPEQFNNDMYFRRSIEHAVGIKAFQWVDSDFLEQLGRKGHSASPCLPIVARRLEYGDADVETRCKAIITLPKIVEKGDKEAIKVVAAQLGDDDAEIRKASMEALQRLKDFGDPVINELRRLTDSDARIRKDSLQMLRGIAARQRGNRPAIEALAYRLRVEEDWNIRRVIMESLVDFAEKGDERAIDAVVTRLADNAPPVQLQALRVLGQLAEKADQRVIDAMTVRLGDDDPQVRQAAVIGIKLLAEKGDPTTLEALVARLGDEDAKVREAAVLSVEQLAEKGDRGVLEPLAALLADGDQQVRRAATRAVGDLAEKGDQCIIEKLTAALTDDDPLVRQAAVAGIKVLAEKADRKVLLALTARLCDDDAKVRRSAISSVEVLAQKGDQGVLEALFKQHMDEDQQVRFAATRALGGLAQTGDRSTIEAMTARIADEDPKVRRAAVIGLELHAEKGDQAVLDVLAAQLEDEDNHVRHAATRVVGKLAERGDEHVLQVMVRQFVDNDPKIRQAAIVGAGMLAEKGDRGVLEALIGQLSDRNEQVRLAATCALGEVAVKHDQAVIEALVLQLEDADQEVRLAAGRAIRELSPYRRVIEEMTHRLRDDDPQVRQAAAKNIKLLGKADKDALRAAAPDMCSR